MDSRVLLGCQDWAHTDWVGSLYAEAEGPVDMLRRYATEFPTVEVSDTFRGIPPASLVRAWRDAVPAGFSFALKVPQQVTHERRLEDADRLLRHFVSRVATLGDRLGPLLVALPAGWACSDEARLRFGSFIASLPAEFRWAVEFRRSDWLAPAVLDSLASRGVAVVLAEDRWLRQCRVVHLAALPTADFAYLRWNRPLWPTERQRAAGAPEPITGETLVRDLAARVGTVYGYFSNRYSGHAPDDVERLGRLLHLPNANLKDRGQLAETT